MPPAVGQGGRFEHGSALGGKTRSDRVSSQWKSTSARDSRVIFVSLWGLGGPFPDRRSARAAHRKTFVPRADDESENLHFGEGWRRPTSNLTDTYVDLTLASGKRYDREKGRFQTMSESISTMKRLIVDLDHTICRPRSDDDQSNDVNLKYINAEPIHDVIDKLKDYKSLGFEIVINTSRNMRTYNGDIDLIRFNTLPLVIAWLNENDVPYDEIIVGKPWCGFDGVYIDDRAIRPSELVALSYEAIMQLVEAEQKR